MYLAKIQKLKQAKPGQEINQPDNGSLQLKHPKGLIITLIFK